jgi:two-component system chemotaxis response regulator CheY
MQVLIVDDSKAMRMIVIRALKQAGFRRHEFLQAGNGREALEMIEKKPPDLVLCDWNMPEMNGYDLLTALNGKDPRPKFGFVTSEGTRDMKQAARDAGALFIITKPFTPEAFDAALGSILG